MSERRRLREEQPTRYPYLVGVYLATNAIADAAAVVDGPDCTFFKAEFIHGKHDLGSTLLDVQGNHRILVSHTTTDNIATSRGDEVAARLHDAGRLPGIGLVLITSMPMVSIIGLQYDQLIREHGGDLWADLALVPGRSLEGDWLHGYADTLTALAEILEPPEQPLAEDSVSIIGYLMDRNEEDHHANVAELERLVQALDLKADSVWLSGRSWRELRRARRSATLLALPLGRRAARILADKTGARVVEVDPPFGLTGSAAFLRALGQATGRADRAERFITAELTQSASRLEWAVPHFFLGLKLAISVTPDLLAGFCDIAGELGMVVVELASPALQPDWFDDAPLGGRTVAFDRRFDLRSWRDENAPDVVIGDSLQLREARGRYPVVELGFPSHADHALFERPYLGFRGHAALLQRIVSARAVWSGSPSPR